MWRKYFFSIGILVVINYSLAAEVPEAEEWKKQIAPRVRKSDLIIEGEILNIVKGKSEEIAVLRISKVLKGIRGLKKIYFSFKRDEIEDAERIFAIENKGLWLLTVDKSGKFYRLDNSDDFQNPESSKHIEEILESQISTSIEDLQLRIASDKKGYAVDEPIRIDLTIENIGEKDVIYEITDLWGYTRGFVLTRISDEKEDKIATVEASGNYEGSYAGPCFKNLEPKSAHTKPFNLLRVLALYAKNSVSGERISFLAEGSYRLRVVSDTTFINDDFPSAKPMYGITGRILSNSISFDITKQSSGELEDAIQYVEQKGNIPNLEKALSGEDIEEKSKALNAIVEFANLDLFPLLKKMMQNQDEHLRDVACRAIYQLGLHPKIKGKKIFQEYFDNLDWDKDRALLDQMGSWAADLAGLQNDKSMTPYLLRLLKSEDVETATKKSIASTLSFLTGLEFDYSDLEKAAETVEEWWEANKDKIDEEK